MNQVILMDNDALLKLACYGLLAEAMSVLNIQVHDVYLLAATKYVLMPHNNRLEFCGDEESATRLTEFIASANRVKAEAADPDDLDLLTGSPNIDAGEALLLATGAAKDQALIVTGDKRSLAALCANSSLDAIATSLKGRIVCMEVLFAIMVEQHFESVQKRVRSKPNVDKALTIIFGVSLAAEWASVQEGLNSYISHLVNQADNLLYLPKS